jgi:hypothetical protein
MSSLIKLSVLGFMVYVVTVSVRHTSLDTIIRTLWLVATDVQRGITTLPNSMLGTPTPIQNGVLMQPGLWSVTTTGSMSGQPINASETKCITPTMVAQITSGDASMILNGQSVGSCQMQQQLIGRQLVATGQCGMGNGTIQLSARIIFDTPQHLTEQATFSGIMGAQHLDISAFAEGRLVGGC